MSKGIFISIFCLITFAKYSNIANASKYYYESYEPSAMYATADSATQNDIKQINKATKTMKKTTSTSDNVIKNTIFLKMRKKQETQPVNTASKSTANYNTENEDYERNTAQRVQNDITASRIAEMEAKSAKEAFLNKRIAGYMTIGFNLGAFPTIEYNNPAGDFGNNDKYTKPVNKPFKALYGLDVSLGAKFYPLKSRTGPFVGAEFFYKYMNGKSNYNWQSQLSYQYQASSGTASTLHDDYSPDGAGKTSQDGYQKYNLLTQNAYLPSTMVSQMEHLLGLGLRIGYSINRFSIYGRFNIGGIQMRHDLSMSDDALYHIRNMSSGTSPDADDKKYGQYYAYQAIRANATGEYHKNFVTAFGPGVGIEFAVNENIFLRVEYNHFFVSQTLKFDKINKKVAIQDDVMASDFGVLQEYLPDNGIDHITEKTTAYKTTNGAEQMKIKMDFGTITASIGIVF